MRRRILTWIGVGVVGLAVGGALLSSHRRSEALQRDVQALRSKAEDVRRLEGERDQLLASQPSAERLAALRADRVALERVRSELRTLQNAIVRLPNVRTGEAAMIPAANWTNAGHATPAAALETTLWSSRRGDVDQLAALLSFDDPVLSQAKALFDRLPAEARHSHGSPERLIALLTARNASYEAMQIAATTSISEANLKRLQEAQPNVTGMVILQARLHTTGQSPQIKTLVLRQQADGWRLVVPPSAIDRYAKQLADTAP